MALSLYCGTNVPGIATVEIAAIDNLAVDQFPFFVVNGEIDEPPFIGEADWEKVGLLVQETSLVTSSRITAQGPQYSHRLTGVTPYMQPSTISTLHKMLGKRYVARLTDYNQRKWLVGTVECPLDFTYEIINSQSDGFASYRLIWSADSTTSPHGLRI